MGGDVSKVLTLKQGRSEKSFSQAKGSGGTKGLM